MRKVSIKDLAARTGLSLATVSLSLRDHPRISDDTKGRVRKAAQELGYVYNRQAANLRMNRTRTIAVCLNTIENPVISRIFTGLLHFFQSQDWMVVFGDSEDSPEKQAAFLSTTLENNVAALGGALARQARRADGGIAAAMALGGTVMPPDMTVAVSFNLATYRGQQGFSGAIVARVTDHVWVSGGVAGSTVHGSTGGRAGITFGW